MKRIVALAVVAAVAASLKKTRPCGPDGKFKVYSQMSIDGRPFRSILYCGD